MSFTIPSGQYGILMGKTGCGKTTVLEAVAGLRPVRRGAVWLNDRDVTALPPAARGVGYVPQDAALFKTMTVRDHLAFALIIRRASWVEIRQRTEELANWLGLTHLLDRKPAGLSGGEAQRVALGRALSFRPSVLLMDEPLSSLDDDTRDQLMELLNGLRRQRTVTVLHVTHNRSEAKLLGDVVLKLEGGQVLASEASS